MILSENELINKFKSLQTFSPTNVEKLICEFGISDKFNCLPKEYDKYLTDSEDSLYFSPVVLAELLVRLKPFININSLNYYTNIEPISYDLSFNFILSNFIELNSIVQTECAITDEISNCDIAYVTDNIEISKFKDIIDKTKNVIIIEDLHNMERLECIQQFKSLCVISYHVHDGIDNPKSSVAILVKSFEMFE